MHVVGVASTGAMSCGKERPSGNAPASTPTSIACASSVADPPIPVDPPVPVPVDPPVPVAPPVPATPKSTVCKSGCGVRSGVTPASGSACASIPLGPRPGTDANALNRAAEKNQKADTCKLLHDHTSIIGRPGGRVYSKRRNLAKQQVKAEDCGARRDATQHHGFLVKCTGRFDRTGEYLLHSGSVI